MKSRSRILLALAALTAGLSVRAAALETKAAAPPAAGDTVAIVAGEPITQAQLATAAEAQLLKLRSQEYDIKKRVLDDLITEALLSKEAAARGISIEELNRTEIDAKAPAVTDVETKAFYDANKARFGDKPEADVLKMIQPALTQQKVTQRRVDFLAELRGKAAVKILLDAPRIPITVGDEAMRGRKDAPITLVEYSDFQCPFCGRVEPTIKQIQDRYGDQVRVIWRDYPLSFHQFAQKASEAGQCAREQGKFWEMHDAMFGNQAKLAVDDLKATAAQMGLNPDQFNQCLDTGKTSQAISKTVDEGSKYGVTGTPAFFINGRMLVGAQPVEQFTQVINEELERAGLPIPPAPAQPAGATSSVAPPAGTIAVQQVIPSPTPTPVVPAKPADKQPQPPR